jgi:hypothetical protein
MAWSRVPFSRAETFVGAHHRVVNEAVTSLRAAGNPQEAAVFGMTLPETGEVELFFSPRASDLLESLLNRNPATQCERPERRDVRLVVGPESAWGLLD